MHSFERFHYNRLEELLSEFERLGLELPVTDDLSPLAEPMGIGDRTVPNRLVVHPMEGCDCTGEGSPGELTKRRYLRFARGGAGTVWFEACAVSPHGRGNPRQMMLTGANVGEFTRLLDAMRKAAHEVLGQNHELLVVLQLNHAGRYSKPQGRPEPVLAHHVPALDRAQGIPADQPLVKDVQVDRIVDACVRTAELARRAGFDAVDAKACHGYLPAGLLAAFTRSGSRYGGDAYENRTRFIRDVHRRVRAELPGLLMVTRLGFWDALPHPWGWGVDRDEPGRHDLREPLQLCTDLVQEGLQCINVTVGNPYFHPHLNRPFDFPTMGSEPPAEHPLASVHRLLEIAGRVQCALPGVPVVGTGYSYLRQFAPQFAAAAVAAGRASLVGFGRMALAYPDFARDILTRGRLAPDRACIACSRCSQLMRDGQPAGCVVRDRQVYGPLFREGRRRAKRKS